jgi:hypothetical protein
VEKGETITLKRPDGLRIVILNFLLVSSLDGISNLPQRASLRLGNFSDVEKLGVAKEFRNGRIPERVRTKNSAEGNQGWLD